MRKAEAALRKALEVDPASVPAHLNLGMLFAADRRFGEAEAGFRAALRSDPGFSPARALLGTLDEVERELASTGGDPVNRARRARILERVGTRRAAEAWLPVAISESSSAADRREAVSFLVALGSEDEARRAVGELSRHSPGSPGVRDLRDAFVRREARERKLDELVGRLQLVQSIDVPGLLR